MEYEILSKDLKLRWIENFAWESERYTQVSGYIFDSENRLLIVKSEAWTIPGGHPEGSETPLETLIREIAEEACVTVKNARYLGAVEVVEKGERYYQLRYIAKLDEILPFKKEWEVSERAFVPIDDLDKYIKWANGATFRAQIESAKKFLKES